MREEDFSRYARNLQLPGFTVEKQLALQSSRIFIVGAGALGSVAAMYLAASGVGHIRVCDFDNIDISNLQRQVFYTAEDVGKGKCRVLKDRIYALDPDVEVETVERFMTPKLLKEALVGIDVILECSDNPATKNMVVFAGKDAGIPVVVGGVREFSGQIAVFTPDSPDYTDIFPDETCSPILPCSSLGVFGPVPGVVASLQAAEAMKILCDLPGQLKNNLLNFDLCSMQFTRFSF